MVVFITAGEIFAKIKNMFLPNKIVNSKATLKILFYGNENQLDKINHLLNDTPHRVLQKKVFTNETIPTQLILEESNDPAVNSILFCEAGISNSLIIESIQNLPKNTVALFYENTAESIIGSSNKNEPGVFISNQ